MLPNRAADRFSNRAEEYDNYRPRYPEALLSALERHKALTPESVVLDIGSGTGIFSRQIQSRCAYLYAIEPNTEMRKASLEHLRDLDHVVVLEGRAENTGLRENSVDLIVAAQAFHWFDTFWTYEEWGRILRPHGRIALIWNERATEIDDFHRDYEQLLLDWGTDYQSVDHRRFNLSAIQQFLEPETLQVEHFDHAQELDFKALKGRLLSSSYVPREDAENYQGMIDQLANIFEQHSTDGTVTMRYVTKLYLGTLIQNLDEDDEDDEDEQHGGS